MNNTELKRVILSLIVTERTRTDDEVKNRLPANPYFLDVQEFWVPMPGTVESMNFNRAFKAVAAHFGYTDGLPESCAECEPPPWREHEE